jgi:hypothetical protein
LLTIQSSHKGSTLSNFSLNEPIVIFVSILVVIEMTSANTHEIVSHKRREKHIP